MEDGSVKKMEGSKRSEWRGSMKFVAMRNHILTNEDLFILCFGCLRPRQDRQSSS